MYLRTSLSILLVSLPLAAQQSVAATATTTVELSAAAPAAALLPPGMAEAIVAEGIEGSQAMRILEDMTGTIGHRLTGSDNFSQACNWAMGEFQEMGVPIVKLEKWAEWNLAWNRGVWRGAITTPEHIDLYVATEAWTAGTNGPRVGVITAAPKSVDDVDGKSVGGKWVYYSKSPAKAIRDACEQVGILGWLYRAGDPDARFPNRVRVFGRHTTARLPLEQVPTVPRIAIRATEADRLADMLAANQHVTGEFEIDNTFRQGPIPIYNVVAEIPGSEKSDEVVIICGHLDSWHQAQGCTDNGTGSATTMEAARILMAVGAKPKRTIRFCLWGGEEQGLLGSGAYVKQHRTEMDKVSAVFNHDTGTNWAYSISLANGMAEQLEPVFAPVLELLTPPDAYHDGPVFKINRSERLRGGGGSDHASFLAAGVPGLSWGLTGRSNYFQQTWHTQWDTFDVAIPEYQRHTSTVVALAALGTANLDALLSREGIDRSGGRRGQSRNIGEAIFGAKMEGMKFTEVQKDGRAAKMGVMKGDVLKKLNGEELMQLVEMFGVMRGAEGEYYTFTVQRGDKMVDLKLKRDELRRGRD